MVDFFKQYIIASEFITQLFATIIGIITSIFTTLITLHIQGKREAKAKKQLQDANIRTAIELFRAYIACLLPFHKSEYSADECGFLLTQCHKTENIEHALSKLNSSDFPNKFLNALISFQVRIMLLRISLESALKDACDNHSCLCLDTADIHNLLKEITEFINDPTMKPED